MVELHLKIRFGITQLGFIVLFQKILVDDWNLEVLSMKCKILFVSPRRCSLRDSKSKPTAIFSPESSIEECSKHVTVQTPKVSLYYDLESILSRLFRV